MLTPSLKLSKLKISRIGMKVETYTCCTQKMRQCAEAYERNELMDISGQETSARKREGQAIDSESR